MSNELDELVRAALDAGLIEPTKLPFDLHPPARILYPAYSHQALKRNQRKRSK